MRYEFVYKRLNDWSFEESSIIEKTIEFVNNPIEGDPVFVIGKYLASLVKVKFLIIGSIDPLTQEKVDTVCFLKYGEQLPNISYDLKGTPCHSTFIHDVCYYPCGVRAEFPNDADLVEMNIDSYMGTSIIDKNGEKIGLIVLLDEVTIQNPGFLDYILTIVSPVLEQHFLAQQSSLVITGN
jgi:hypothetical protein